MFGKSETFIFNELNRRLFHNHCLETWRYPPYPTGINLLGAPGAWAARQSECANRDSIVRNPQMPSVNKRRINNFQMGRAELAVVALLYAIANWFARTALRVGY